MSVSCECSVVRQADHLSRGVLPSVICVIEYDRKACAVGRPWPTRGCHSMKKKSFPLLDIIKILARMYFIVVGY